MRNRKAWAGGAFPAAVLFLAALSASAAEAPRISPAELKSLLGNADLALIDVRLEGAATGKIPGAVVEDAQKVDEWAKKYPKEKTIVLYCS